MNSWVVLMSTIRITKFLDNCPKVRALCLARMEAIAYFTILKRILNP
jgi:hypothetical protein